MRVLDKTVRPKLSRWAWWRLYVAVGRTPSGVRFETGTHWLYRGLIHRWARSFGRIDVAVLRLIGDGMEPYDGDESMEPCHACGHEKLHHSPMAGCTVETNPDRFEVCPCNQRHRKRVVPDR